MGSREDIEDESHGFEPRISRKDAIIFVIVFLILTVTTYLDSLPQ